MTVWSLQFGRAVGRSLHAISACQQTLHLVSAVTAVGLRSCTQHVFTTRLLTAKYFDRQLSLRGNRPTISCNILNTLLFTLERNLFTRIYLLHLSGQIRLLENSQHCATMAKNFQFSALWTISTHQQWKSGMSPVHILIGVKLLISENRPEVKIFYMNNDKCATVGACGSAWSCYWRRICTGQTRSSRERICLVTAVPRAMNYKYTYRCVAVALSRSQRYRTVM